MHLPSRQLRHRRTSDLGIPINPTARTGASALRDRVLAPASGTP